jgi:hypothetical protein
MPGMPPSVWRKFYRDDFLHAFRLSLVFVAAGLDLVKLHGSSSRRDDRHVAVT